MNIVREIIGLSKNNEKVIQFISSTTENTPPEIKKFKEIECHSYKKYGLAIDFKNDKIDSIFLYNKNSYGFDQYKGEIPDNLDFNLTNSEIVQKYGEPSGKGGFNIPVWISYEEKGIQIDFINSSYEDNKNPVAFYTFF
jgi:hypothetical protein